MSLVNYHPIKSICDASKCFKKRRNKQNFRIFSMPGFFIESQVSKKVIDGLIFAWGKTKEISTPYENEAHFLFSHCQLHQVYTNKNFFFFKPIIKFSILMKMLSQNEH